MKNRKWGMALIAALLCLCMALSACSNDADNDPNEVVGQDWPHGAWWWTAGQ